MPQSTFESFDEVDRSLIRILQRDGRATLSDLGTHVHLSAPSVAARLRKLEAAGVIRGYAAIVDPGRLGYPIHAVIRLRTTHSQIPAALETFQELTEIQLIYRLTGEDCFLLDVHASSAERLEELVDTIGYLGPVSTSLVLREYPAKPLPD